MFSHCRCVSLLPTWAFFLSVCECVPNNGRAKEKKTHKNENSPYQKIKQKEEKKIGTIQILCESTWRHNVRRRRSGDGSKRQWNWYNENNQNTHPFKCMRHIALIRTKLHFGHYTFINLCSLLLLLLFFSVRYSHNAVESIR